MSGEIVNMQLSDEERLRLLLSAQRHRLLNERYRYFTPIGKFEEFIETIATGKYKSGLLEAANGVGKTFGMANLLAHLFWPVKDNKYFQGFLFHHWLYPKKGRIISDPNTITETIIPTLKTVFPQGRYNNTNRVTTTKEGKRFESHWITDTGWDFTLMTYEQDVKEFESATLGFVWCDEPPPREIYTANIARLRMGGIIMITETPLSGSQWLYDDFTDKPPETLKRQRKFIIHAELEDACAEHGIRGFIPHEKIEEMGEQYEDENEREARIFGKHAHLLGLVFKKWSERIHVIKPFKLLPADWLTVHALDPHTKVNDAVFYLVIYGIPYYSYRICPFLAALLIH